jgi:ferredoxin--NADP+ reductase
MLCGNPAMVTDARALLKERGFAVGRRGIPGNLAVENYW